MRPVRALAAEGWSDARIAVNVSTVQLRSRDFIASVDRALSDAGLEPEALELELTEGVFIEERGGASSCASCATKASQSPSTTSEPGSPP